MKTESPDWKVLAKWLFDDCSTQELNAVHSYLEVNPNALKELTEIQKMLCQLNYFPGRENTLLDKIKVCLSNHGKVK